MRSVRSFLGAPPRGDHTELALWPEDHRAAAALGAGYPAPFFGVHPGAREPGKQWPSDRYAAVAGALQRRHGGTAVLLGDRAAYPGTSAVACTLDSRRCLDLTGRTSVATLGAVIARLALLLTNDSGPAHCAYALRTPTVTLFGPTDPAVWDPPADPGFQVVATQQTAGASDGRTLLHAIGAERVLAAAETALAARSSSLSPLLPTTLR